MLNGLKFFLQGVIVVLGNFGTDIHYLIHIFFRNTQVGQLFNSVLGQGSCLKITEIQQFQFAWRNVNAALGSKFQGTIPNEEIEAAIQGDSASLEQELLEIVGRCCSIPGVPRTLSSCF
jgi:hypothetical protein